MDSVYDYLLNKKQAQVDPADVESQKRVENAQLIASIGAALDQYSGAGDRARTGAKFDPSLYQGLKQQAVGNANQERADRAKAVEQSLLARKVGQEDVLAQREQESAARKAAQEEAVAQRAAAKFGPEQEVIRREADPTSEDSKQAQIIAKKVSPGLDVTNLSATQLMKLMPTLMSIREGEQRSSDRRVTADATASAAKERSDRLKELDEEKRHNLSEKKDLAAQARLVPGYGEALTTTDANQLKSAVEQKREFDRQLQEMIDLRVKHNGGAIFNRDDVERGKQLSKDLLLKYKDMAKLGVLSVSDEKILNAIIPDDPLAYTAAGLIGQDPIMTRLTKFKEDTQADFGSKLSSRLAPKPQFPIDLQRGGKTITVENQDELDEAKNDGWK